MATQPPPHPPLPLPTIQSALLSSVLSTHASKLRLDYSASILVSNTSLATSLAQWLADEKRDMPHSIVAVSTSSQCESDIPADLARAASISIVETPQDDIFTHAFAHVEDGSDRDEVLWALKRCFYGLMPKGVAIVSIVTKSPLDAVLRGDRGGAGEELSEGELMGLAERATFEVGKVRLFKREVKIEGEQVDALKAEVEARGGSDHLKEEVWEKARLEGLVVEAWVVVAMRWDLLCA
ncbi:hypothetical protein TI39_contig4150g00005 [Zymoseptoria brevis]|uniref:Uncharacterized protein n=1 Tax=Zymoseptoria brevis TaxID=1047168 RepID=A0A0F4GC21_9PEZI|nr:hypothetical protein TI39_contig4150g00005 [Zymoseptoria brevis]